MLSQGICLLLAEDLYEVVVLRRDEFIELSELIVSRIRRSGLEGRWRLRLVENIDNRGLEVIPPSSRTKSGCIDETYVDLCDGSAERGGYRSIGFGRGHWGCWGVVQRRRRRGDCRIGSRGRSYSEMDAVCCPVNQRIVLA